MLRVFAVELTCKKPLLCAITVPKLPVRLNLFGSALSLIKSSEVKFIKDDKENIVVVESKLAVQERASNCPCLMLLCQVFVLMKTCVGSVADHCGQETGRTSAGSAGLSRPCGCKRLPAEPRL